MPVRAHRGDAGGAGGELCFFEAFFFLDEVEQHVHGDGGGGGEVLVAAVVLFNDAGDGATGVAYGNPNGADDYARLAAVGAAGTCIAADGYGIVSIEELVAAADHLLYDFFADGGVGLNDCCVYAEQIDFHFVGVADESALVVVGTARYGGYDAGNAACRAAFGRGEGFAVAPEIFVDFLAYEFEI